MEDFGVIVACCDQDYLFAKGCCASIRHFLGDVPICLLVDGTFSVSDLEKAYNVRVINHLNVKHQVLRQRSFGWGKTKMVAFWESPWQNFLVLDADTIVWGNLLKFANFEKFDFIIDRPCYEYSDEAVAEFFFDLPGIEQHYPNFPWQKYRNNYFCTGCFFAKRDVFNLDDYIAILDFVEKYPKVFKYGEMGFLNFMIFRGVNEGKIRLGQEDWQFLVPDFPLEALQKRFPMTAAGPEVQGEDATVIHWCGPKPMLASSQVYAEPMSFCRRKFQQDAWGKSGLSAELSLQVEDFYRYLYVYKNKFRRLYKNKVLPYLQGKMG